jgi:hypothetical protein
LSRAFFGGKTIRANKKRSPVKNRSGVKRKISGPPTRLSKAGDRGVTCNEEVAFIGNYLSSDLDPQKARAFESHLKICGDCVAFLRTYKKTIALTRAFLTGPAQEKRNRAGSLRLP